MNTEITEPWNEEWDDRGIKDWNKDVIQEFRTNGGKVGGAYAGGSLLLLTTTGARSGKRHTVPLAYYDNGTYLFTIAGSHNPAWTFNIKANPTVTIEVGTETFEGTAIITTGEEREQLWTWALEQIPQIIEFQNKSKYPLPIVVFKR